MTFLWTRNGINVRRTYLSISGATSRLTISNVRYSDGGSYVCIVKRGSLSVTSNTATITVYGKLKCSYVCQLYDHHNYNFVISSS